MIATIHQPEHMPWLGFFGKADLADTLILLDTVQYRSRYFQNRNRILTEDGVKWITVPVFSKGHRERTIRDIEIDSGQRWQRRYRETVRRNYKDHPYYETYADLIDDVGCRSWAKLADLNEHVIRYLADALGIQTRIVRSSNVGGDGSSSELLVDTCRRIGATTYLAGQLAPRYLDTSIFDAAGIRVVHHRFSHPTYPQLRTQEFVSHLSVLDLLCNCGPDSLDIIRTENELAAYEAT
jgi:hypothetical protein